MTSPDQMKVNSLIIDDLMREMNEAVEKMFTKDSHHINLSNIRRTQI